MRGNVNYQVQQLYSCVKAIGESKHAAKDYARSTGAKTTAQIAQKTGIHSYSTADAYRAVWRSIGEFAKAEFRVKDMARLEGRHVAAFLERKIEEGISRATFDQYSAAAAKLETALNRFADQAKTENHYKFDLREVRANAAQELGARNHEARAYDAPSRILSHLNGEHRLTAALQIEGGGRFKEVSHISENQLKGVHADKITGEVRGTIAVDGKGGKERVLQISPATYAELKSALTNGNGLFEVPDYKGYLAALENAAKETGQDYNGSHGLRWNFAQCRMDQLQTHGMSYEEALGEVSRDMGHERSDITLHYLK